MQSRRREKPQEPQKPLACTKCLGSQAGVRAQAARLRSAKHPEVWELQTQACYRHGHMQAGTAEPSQQSVGRAANSSQRPRARQAFLGADGDTKGHAIKPFPGDTKIIPCTFQLPEQQSPEKQALWESLSSLFLGIINRITAARPFNGLRLNSGPGGRPAPCTTAGPFLTNQNTRAAALGTRKPRPSTARQTPQATGPQMRTRRHGGGRTGVRFPKMFSSLHLKGLKNFSSRRLPAS